MQGIWPPQKDGTECTACDCNLFRGEDGVVVASGDNYGRIRLFRCVVYLVSRLNSFFKSLCNISLPQIPLHVSLRVEQAVLGVRPPHHAHPLRQRGQHADQPHRREQEHHAVEAPQGP